MTLEQAKRVLGQPEHVREQSQQAPWGSNEASWHPNFRCFFDEAWSLEEIAIVAAYERRIRVGEELLLSRDFDIAAEQLAEYTGTGYRDSFEHLAIFPEHGLRVWSEEGTWLDSFECATSERCVGALGPGWPEEYHLM